MERGGGLGGEGTFAASVSIWGRAAVRGIKRTMLLAALMAVGADPCVDGALTACEVRVAAGPNVLTSLKVPAKDFSDHQGTLDALLATTPLHYWREYTGLGGWNLHTDQLALRNQPNGKRGQGTSNACYEGGRYVCPPGPCSVLEVNYLADFAQPGGLTRGQNKVVGRSYCGASFGTQMVFRQPHQLPEVTATSGNEIDHRFEPGEVLPSGQAARTTLSKLVGSKPETVQTLVPANDVVNRIPAWYYKSMDDWRANLEMRTDGKACFDRVVPGWMIPRPTRGANEGGNRDAERDAGAPDEVAPDGTTISHPGLNTGPGLVKSVLNDGTENEYLMDHDNSYVRTRLHVLVKNQDYPQTTMDSRNGPYYPVLTDPANYNEGSYDLKNLLDETFHRTTWRTDDPVLAGGRGAFTLCDSGFLRGTLLGLSPQEHRVFKTKTWSKLFSGTAAFDGGYQALQKLLADNCEGSRECDLPELIRQGLASNDTAVQQQATLALLFGQAATVIRPCEPPRSRQRKYMAATYNQWRKAYFNPGNNRRAVEQVLGCDPENPYMDEVCAAVRAHHHWSEQSSCAKLGTCVSHGNACCTAQHLPMAPGLDFSKASPADRAYHFDSEACTSITEASTLAQLEDSAYSEAVHTSNQKNALKRMRKRSFQHSRRRKKCGVMTIWNSSLSQFQTHDPSWGNKRVGAHFNIGDAALAGAAFLAGAAVPGCFQVCGMAAAGAVAGGDIAAQKGGKRIKDIMDTNYNFYDPTAVLWLGTIENTCNDYAGNFGRFWVALTSCLSKALPYVLLQEPQASLERMKIRIAGGENANPLCGIMAAAINPNSNKYADAGTKMPEKYKTMPVLKACIDTDAFNTMDGRPTGWPSDAPTWWKDTLLSAALTGPSLAYMDTADWDYKYTNRSNSDDEGSSLLPGWFNMFMIRNEDDNIRRYGPVSKDFTKLVGYKLSGPPDTLTDHHHIKVHATLLENDMQTQSRFPMQPHLPPPVEFEMNDYNTGTQDDNYNHYFRFGGNVEDYDPGVAQSLLSAIKDNEQGQSCRGNFRWRDFRAILLFTQLWFTGPTTAPEHYDDVQGDGDWLESPTIGKKIRSCFGSRAHTKATDKCGWPSSRFKHIFGDANLQNTFQTENTVRLSDEGLVSTTPRSYSKPDKDHDCTDDDSRTMDIDKCHKTTQYRTSRFGKNFYDHTSNSNITVDGYLQACVETPLNLKMVLPSVRHRTKGRTDPITAATPFNNLQDAIWACEALRSQGCVAVQRLESQARRDRRAGHQAHYYLRSEADVGNGRTVAATGTCTRLYLVPCYGVETCNDLFGCNEDPRVRATVSTATKGLVPPPQWIEPAAYEKYANESYWLDGLAHYTANTLFTLNRAAFEDTRSTLPQDYRRTGPLYDFNLSAWVQSAEARPSPSFRRTGNGNVTKVQGKPGSVPLVTVPGVAAGGLHGIDHLPRHISGERKLRMFSWAGMFDAEEYERGGGVYRFRHPSASPEKYPGAFKKMKVVSEDPPTDYGNESAPLGANLHVNIGEELQLMLNDFFAREVLGETLDTSTEDGIEDWKHGFWNAVRSLTQAEGGRVTLGGFIDPLGEDATIHKSAMELAAYSTGVGTTDKNLAISSSSFIPKTTEWDDFKEAYENICDLHACDIVMEPPKTTQDITADDLQLTETEFATLKSAASNGNLDTADLTGFSSRLTDNLLQTYRNLADALTNDQQYFGIEEGWWACVPRNQTAFYSGARLVPAEAAVWLESLGQWTSDAFSQMGFPLVSIERSILYGVVTRMLKRAEAAAVEGASIPFTDALIAAKEQLESACTNYEPTTPTGTQAMSTGCNVLGAWISHLGEAGARSAEYKDGAGIPVHADKQGMPHFAKGPGGDLNDLVNYKELDTSDLFEEHRTAVPVHVMERSASFSNLEEHKNAVPCDCADQPVVWSCRHEVADGFGYVPPALDPLAPTSFTMPDKAPEGLILYQCAYSWRIPPARTPKIGLYVPSRVDHIEIFERDVLGDQALPDSICDPDIDTGHDDFDHCSYEALLNASTDNSFVMEGIRAAIANGTLDANHTSLKDCKTRMTGNCSEIHDLAATGKRCVESIFSTVMGPRPAKLREMLFTGQHPLPVPGEDAEDGDETNFLDRNLINSEISECQTVQHRTLYGGACLRWPFGAVHRTTIGYNDEETTTHLNDIFGGDPDPVIKTNGKNYYNTYNMLEEELVWQGYCELESTVDQGYDPFTHNLEDRGEGSRFRYCANDPKSFDERTEFCMHTAPHFIMYAWGVLKRPAVDACNKAGKVCLMVPGYRESGTISELLDSATAGPFDGYTILVSPYSRTVLQHYHAKRHLLEVGNSYERTRQGAHRVPVNGLGSSRGEGTPKHPLEGLVRRDNLTTANADVVMGEDDTHMTGLKGSEDVVAMLAKLPFKTVDEIRKIFATLVSHIEGTCRAVGKDDQRPQVFSHDLKFCDDEGYFGPGGGLSTEERRASGTYFLPPMDTNSHHLVPRSWDEVYAPLKTEVVRVGADNLRITSAVEGGSIRFGPHPSHRHHSETCHRFLVGRPQFRLEGAVFDQTMCSRLPPAAQTPVLMMGAVTSGLSLDADVIYDAEVAAAVATAFRGGDQSVFYGPPVMVADPATIRVGIRLQDAETQAVSGPDPDVELYFHTAAARTEGTVTIRKRKCCEDPLGTGNCGCAVHGPTCCLADVLCCANESLSVIFESDATEVSLGTEFRCSSSTPADTMHPMFSNIGNCRALNVTAVTEVVGVDLEKVLEPHEPSSHNGDLILAIFLVLVLLAIALLNAGLLLSVDREAHRVVGLLGPDEELYRDFGPLGTTPAPEAAPTVGAPMSLLMRRPMGRAAARAPPAPVPLEWRAIHAGAREGGWWLWLTGYGTQVEVLKTGEVYDLEPLLAAAAAGRKLSAGLPPSLVARIKVYAQQSGLSAP